jgi:hypothetical protein
MATQTNPSKAGQSKTAAQSNRQASNAGSKGGLRAAGSLGTAATDETYGIVSVLYHALQGAQTYGQYIADAERAGNDELVEFFQECQSQENERAQRAKRLLASQLGDIEDEDEEEEEEGDDDEDEDEK